MARVTVLLATEGTYPFHLGGVSTWCDALVNGAHDTDFIIYAVAMNPYVASQFSLPENVRRLITVPLWGTQDPSEHREDAKFSDLFLKKQRTSSSVIQSEFLPLLEAVLNQGLGQEPDAAQFGETLAGLYRYFQLYDYKVTWKDERVWGLFRDWAVATGRAGQWPDPTVFETVQALGWLYHFLIILNTEIPSVDVVHSSAAAFCGMVGVVSRVLFGTPYLLTEHGVYVREQYLSVGRSNMTRFSKRFLLAMVSAVVRANLHYADQLSPVCAFNTRWERLLGANPRKIRVIYNGVSPQTFFPAAPHPLSDATAAPVEILSIARSDPNKDLESLLRAAAIVKQQVPNVHFAVQGSVSVPDYHAEMLALRKTLDLEDVVEFRGHSADVAEAYRHADIMVQSSVSEAFPYSVIEAMMSGLPVVATDVGGTREALVDTGIVVPARDPARLALGLIILAQDKALRRNLGVKAQRRAQEHFTIVRAIREFSDAYRRLAGVYQPSALRDERVVLLDKAYALLRIGLWEDGLKRLEEALAQDPSGAAAPVLMVQIAEVEKALGRRADSQRRLVGAWLLAQERPQGEGSPSIRAG